MPKQTSRYGVKRRGEKWTARPYVAGRGHIWAGTHDTEREAIEAAVETMKAEERLPANKETIATFAARWVRDFPRPKESTNDRYHYDAARFAEEYGSRKLHEVTVPEARRYAQKRPHDHAALRAMFNDARRDGLVDRNPFSELGISKGKGRTEINPVTEEEVEKLADLALAAHGREFGPVFRSILIWAAETTMRPSEIFGLDRPDVDFESETVQIRRQFYKRRIQLPKSGQARKLPYLPPRAAQAVREMPRRVPRAICPVTKGEILFPGKHGQRITAGTLSNYWAPVRTAFEATLEPQRLSELLSSDGGLDFYAVTRHFGATRMVERGVESWIVARMLGHTDGGRLVERRYGHPRDDVARERLRRAFQQNVKPLRAVDDDTEAAHG